MKYSILIALLLFTLGTSAQDGTKSNRVYQAKIKFFNEKLDLTKSDANKFWPIYNDYQSRKNKLSKEKQVIVQYFNDNRENMSADEIEESLNRFIEIDKEKSLLLEEYNKKFKHILPDEKVLQIYIVEVKFREYLIQQLRRNKPEMKPRM